MTTRGQMLASGADAAQRRMAAELFGLDDDDLSFAPAGDWAIRDVLAHIAAWNGFLAAVIDGKDGIEVLGVTRELFANPDGDPMNTEINRQWRLRSIDDVKASFDERHRALASRVAALDDDALARTMRELQPADSPAADDTTLGTWAEWEGAEHYEEHFEVVQDRAAAALAGATVTGELARIDAGAAKLNAMLDTRVPGAEERRDAGGRRLADHLLLLAAWNRDAAAIVEERSRAETVGVSAEVWATGDEALINEAVISASGDLTLDQARRTWSDSIAELRRAVANLDDAGLARIHPPTDPIDSVDVALPVIRWIRSSSGVRLHHHLAGMRRLAGS